MSKNSLVCLFAACALCLQLLWCSLKPVAGGTETTNGVSVAVVGDSVIIKAPAGCLASAYRVDYFAPSNTGPVVSGSLNDSGLVKWNAMSAGFYNMFIVSPNDSIMALIRDISIPTAVKTSWFGRLELPGAISGQLIVTPASPNAIAVVYFIGTPFVDTAGIADSTAHFQLDHVPPGKYTIQYEITDIAPSGVILGTRKGTLLTVSILPGQALDIIEPLFVP